MSCHKIEIEIEKEEDRLRRENVRLRGLVEQLACRIADQAELLAARAQRPAEYIHEVCPFPLHSGLPALCRLLDDKKRDEDADLVGVQQGEIRSLLALSGVPSNVPAVLLIFRKPRPAAEVSDVPADQATPLLH